MTRFLPRGHQTGDSSAVGGDWQKSGVLWLRSSSGPESRPQRYRWRKRALFVTLPKSRHNSADAPSEAPLSVAVAVCCDLRRGSVWAREEKDERREGDEGMKRGGGGDSLKRA